MTNLEQFSFTPGQAADATGIPEETIRSAIRSGDIPLAPLEVNGRRIRKQIILREDLLAWLKAGRS